MINKRIIIKIVIAVIFAILTFFSANRWYFSTNPLLEISYFAETILAIVVGFLTYFIFPVLGTNITFWLEKIISKTVSSTLKRFYLEQKIRNDKKNKEKKEETVRIKKYKESVLVDSSAIIDGRILDIARCGFLQGLVVFPRFVMEEVQQVSDSSDHIKRQRGRKGLDNINELKRILGKSFSVLEQKNGGEVDSLLIKYAKKYDAKILTVDFNLNKLAKVSGIKVLNVNELANAIKTSLIPGEIVPIKISQKGKEENQGVGYLVDGTMVIVENSVNFLGKDVKVEVVRVLQKDAGKMIFAKIVS